MTILPRPQTTYRRMPRAAFNQTVILRPSSYPGTAQGGANPVPAGDYSYSASVQPLGNRGVDSRLGGQATTPQSFTRFDVLIAWADDPIIRAMQIGDAIQWGEKLLSVQAPADDSGGFGTVWHIKCEVVT